MTEVSTISAKELIEVVRRLNGELGGPGAMLQARGRRILHQFPEETDGPNGPKLVFRGVEAFDEERRFTIHFDVCVTVSRIKSA